MTCAAIVARLLARHVQQQPAQVQACVHRASIASLLAVVLKPSSAAVLARQGRLQVAAKGTCALGENATHSHTALLSAQRARASTRALKIRVTLGLAARLLQSRLVLTEPIARVARKIAAHGEALGRRRFLALLRVVGGVACVALVGALLGHLGNTVTLAFGHLGKAIVGNSAHAQGLAMVRRAGRALSERRVLDLGVAHTSAVLAVTLAAHLQATLHGHITASFLALLRRNALAARTRNTHRNLGALGLAAVVVLVQIALGDTAWPSQSLAHGLARRSVDRRADRIARVSRRRTQTLRSTF